MVCIADEMMIAISKPSKDTTQYIGTRYIVTVDCVWEPNNTPTIYSMNQIAFPSPRLPRTPVAVA